MGKVAASQGAVAVLGFLTERADGLARFLDAGSQVDQFHQKILEGAGSYEQYAQKVGLVNSQLPFYVSQLQALTPAQFAAAQSLINTGTAADQAIRNIQGLTGVQTALNQALQVSTPVIDIMAGQLNRVNEVSGQVRAKLEQVAPQLLLLANGNQQAAGTIQALISGLVAGTVSIPQFDAALQALTLAQNSAAQANSQLTDATNQSATASTNSASAIQQEAAQALLAEAQSRLLSEAKTELEQKARNAAIALLNSGNSSAAAVEQLARIVGVAPAVIQAYLGIEKAARAASAAQGQKSTAFQDYRAGERTGGAAKTVAQEQAYNDVARSTTEAQRNLILATGTYAQKHAILAADVAKTVKGTKEYYDALLRLRTLEQSAPGRNGRGRAPTADQVGLSGDDAADLAYYKNKLKGLKQGSGEYIITLNKIQALEAKARKTTTRDNASAASDAKAIQSAKDALLSDAELLQTLKARLAKGNLGELDRLSTLARVKQLESSIGQEQQRNADKLAAAKDALRSTDEKIAARLAELGKNPPEQRRLELQKEINDLVKQQGDELDRQRKAAIDAQLGIIDDREERREEDRKIAQANRVLASGDASQEQKEAALDVLNRIPLEREKRQQEIAKNQEIAGQTAKAVVTAATDAAKTAADAATILKGGPANLPVFDTGTLVDAAKTLQSPPAVPTTPVPVSLPTVPAGVLQAMQTVVNLSITIDGKDIPFKATSSDNRVLLNALTNAARQSGATRS